MKLIDFVMRVGCTMVGYKLHGSVFWAIMDFVFWPIALIKWLVCHEVNWSVVKSTFAFLAG